MALLGDGAAAEARALDATGGGSCALVLRFASPKADTCPAGRGSCNDEDLRHKQRWQMTEKAGHDHRHARLEECSPCVSCMF